MLKLTAPRRLAARIRCADLFGRAVAVAFCALALWPITATAQLPSVEEFFRNPAFSRPTLSPNGTLLAALVATKSGRVQLATLDPSDFAKSRIVAGFSDADVRSIEWVNDRRIVFTAYDASAGGGDQVAPGLFAVDADGSNFRQLVDRRWRAFVGGARAPGDKALPWWTYLVATTRERKSDDVFVVQFPRDPRSARPHDERPDAILLRLNTRTQQTTILSRGAPAGAVGWMLDTEDEPRMLVTEQAGKTAVHFRPASEQPWQKLREFDSYSGQGFVPIRMLADGTAVVRTGIGRDTSALYRFDPKQPQLNPVPLVSVDGFDFNGEPLFDEDRQKLLGVHVNSDGVGTVWLDSGYAELQKVIDSKLPRTVNRLSPPLGRDAALVLVTTLSDVEPPGYYLFNRSDQSLTRIARPDPAIDPKLLGQTDFVRFKARDGLDIPMYVTLPRGDARKNMPTVVLVHGGPWVRGRTWGWNRNTQFLASRGYAVLEPEFRGSLGYGFRHFKAGWRQWGLAMQDDVADAALWAIAQGIADPKRICIAGASYGGYAALMGLVREPELFRCGVSWVGVTDIDLLFTHNWSDVSESGRRFGYGRLIGDPQKDAAKFRSNSPLHNTDKIKQPVLLAYGAQDLRVPLDHGQRFRDALAKTNPDVEWTVYGDEGHDWNKVETRIDFWSRVEKFLQRNIGAQQK